MRNWLIYLWDALRTSFWFLPAAMAAAALALAFLTVTLDEHFGPRWLLEWGWFYRQNAQGARQMLASIAGSMITVAGVVFSITIMTLAQASSQFGPRLLRNFMRDRGNQVVLGTFTATFLYCLLVLRTVQGLEGNSFVPQLSMGVAVILAMASLGVLIFFIHHVAMSIQAPNVIAAVARDLHDAIDELFPEELGRPGAPRLAASDDPPAGYGPEAEPVRAPTSGYLQAVDGASLFETACRNDLVIHLALRPGQFVTEGSPLARVRPSPRVSDAARKAIRDVFLFGPQRTPAQDVEFAIDQLVEVAVRALSPAVNDPFTAVTCVDQLGAALARLARRTFPSPYRHDAAGKLRVVAYPVTFPDLTDAAFNQIRQYGRTSAAVTIRLLETLAVVAARSVRAEDRAALLRHAEMVERGSHGGLPEEEDRQVVRRRYQAVAAALGEEGATA